MGDKGYDPKDPAIVAARTASEQLQAPIPVREPSKFKQWIDKTAQLALGLVGFVLMIGIATQLIVPLQAPKYCGTAFRAEYRRLSDSSAVVRTLFGRTQGDHWLTAVVVQPFDLNSEPVTIVCHFSGTDYVLRRTEMLSGDKTDALKRASMSNFDPRTWFK